MKIENITAKKILDSRGKDTVEVELITDNGIFTASTPSGTSSGKHEAVETTVDKAVYNVNEIIAKELCNRNLINQEEVDNILKRISGENKSILGVNAVLPVSIACCRAFAREQDLPLYSYISQISNNSEIKLPVPSFLLIEGSLHAENSLDVQEFMITANEKSFSENYKAVNKVYDSLGKILNSEIIGLEGGFAPQIENTEKVLDAIMQVLPDNMQIGIDVAASELYKNGKYSFEGKELNGDDLLLVYNALAKKYPIIFIEDPFAEDDLEAWEKTKELRDGGVLIVGDDLTVTNAERMADAHEKNLCNAVILKPNQIGTVTETIKSANLAKEYSWKRIVSHRSGDTNDDFIADLAVGIGSEFIKSGSAKRPERKVKYDRLLQIEQNLL